MILLFSFSLLKFQLIDLFIELHWVLFPACSIFTVSQGPLRCEARSLLVECGLRSYGTWLSCSLACGTLVRSLPALWETWVRSLDWEDPLERERLPTPVFWPGEFHGLYSPWGRKESDTTDRLSHTQ